MVTLAPVRIPNYSRDGRSGPNTFSDTGAGHQFLFEYQTPARFYAATWSFLDGTFENPAVRIYKSLNGGATTAGWIAQDSGNSPLMFGQVFDVLADGASLVVAYLAAADSTLRIRIFDTTPGVDAWGAASAAGPVVSVPTVDQIGFKLVKLASGALRVFFNYSDPVLSTEGCKYVDLAAGVWGAPVVFQAVALPPSRKLFSKLIYDPATSLTHVLWLSPNALDPPTWTLFHQTLTDGGVASVADTIGTVFPGPAGVGPSPAPNIGRCVIFQDFIAVPVTYYRVYSNMTARQVVVFMGTPVAAPAWTPAAVNTVSPLPANESDYEAYCFVSNDGLTLFVFWVFLVSTNATVLPDRLYWVSTADGVSWTDPTLHYDAIANPQSSPSPVGNYIHAISVIELAAGGFGAIVSLQTEDEFAQSECLGYYLIDGAQAPLVIGCGSPPAGLIGRPYAHTFPTAGGVAPLSFAITAGALPPGLTLNGATGALTGSPTLGGVFSFTVEVTDALAVTDSVECSITVTVAAVRGLASGGGFAHGCRDTWPPNFWNKCLDAEADDWRALVAAGGIDLLAGATRDRHSIRDRMPPEGRQLLKIGVLPLPADDGLDHRVLRYRVPVGWDGEIIVMTNLYTGPGFVDGSGDLTWRFKAGARFLPDSGTVEVSRGDLRRAVALEGAYVEIVSNQLVEILVSVAPGAAGRLAPAGLVIGAIMGYTNPRRAARRKALHA